MSAKIVLDNITIKNSSSFFNECIDFQVTFSTLDALKYPISWKVIYVGSAMNEAYDQVLEEFDIDPILIACTSNFQVSCTPPNASKIPKNELLCLTALIITASYRNQQFIRVGYYVHNQLLQQTSSDQFWNLPLQSQISKIKRIIIIDKPRITKFNIEWEEPQSMIAQSKQQVKGNLDYFFSSIHKYNDQESKASEKCTTNESDSCH